MDLQTRREPIDGIRKPADQLSSAAKVRANALPDLQISAIIPAETLRA